MPLQVSIRVGRFEGDLEQRVRKVSTEFSASKIGRDDVPKYCAYVELPGERYYMVVSDRSTISKGEHNMLITVTGPRYEQAEELMHELVSKLGIPTWDAPKQLEENIRLLTYFQGAIQDANN